MDDDRTAAERIAALDARRSAGGGAHPARGARRVTLLASVVAVAGLTGGFALNAADSSATVAATKTVATNTTAATTATTTATTTPSTTAHAVTTSQGS